jgi:hypothetical protein
MSNTASVLSEAGTAYPSRAPEFTTGFCGVRVAHLFSFFVLSYFKVSLRS